MKKRFYINKNLVYVAILVVTLFFRLKINLKISELLEFQNYSKYEINYYFLTIISKLFLFIPYLFNKKDNLLYFKKESLKITLAKKDCNIKIVNRKNIIKIQIFFLLFSCSFLNFFSLNIFQTPDFFFFEPEKSKFRYNEENYSIILFILFQFIFDIKFYNFQYFSIFILLFILIIKNILNVYKYKEDFVHNLKVNSSIIIFQSLFSLSLIIMKYLNTFYYMDMYLIIFISDGILYLIFTCIYEYFLKGNFLKYLDFSSPYLIYYFYFVIINFINSYFFIIVLFLFNPIYYAFAQLIFISIYKIYGLFDENNNDKIYNILIILISLFDLISVFIYSELIQLNCFDFDKNTMNNMIIRAETELGMTDENSSNSEKNINSIN